MSPREILSTRSRAYRELGLAEQNVTEDDLLDLMVKEPTLLRRPILIGRGGSAVGFNQERYEELTAAEGSVT